jgi:hypothetical protein
MEERKKERKKEKKERKKKVVSLEIGLGVHCYTTLPANCLGSIVFLPPI